MLVVLILCHGEQQRQNVLMMDPETFAGADKVFAIVADKGRDLVWPFPVIIPKHGIRGFDAGANRDWALDRAWEQLGPCNVLFLDGDCFPGMEWVEAHKNALEVAGPRLTCGARKEAGKPDGRSLPLLWQGEEYPPTIVSGCDAPISDLRSIVAHRSAWTCNLGINAEAWALLRSAGNVLHGSPRIFAPYFDGFWGGEDTGLAVVAHCLGIELLMLDPQTSTVHHQRHDPFHQTLRNLDKIPAYAESVRKILGPSYLCTSTPIQGHEMPETTELPTRIPASLMEEFLSASKGLKDAQGNMEKAQVGAIASQAVLEYVSKRIAGECQIGPSDTIAEDGTITRVPSAV